MSLEGRGGAVGAHPVTEPPHEAQRSGGAEGGGGTSSSLRLLEEMDVGRPAFLPLHGGCCTDSPLLDT